MWNIKMQNIFLKACILNWSEEDFVMKKVKSTVPCIYLVNDLNGEEIFGTFYEKQNAGKNLKLTK